MNIKKGDKIKVMRGKDRGKEAKVVQVSPAKGKIVVEGVNLRYRHLKPRQANEKGQRVEFPAPMNISNVMLLCPKCNKPIRVSHNNETGKKKMRLCNKCNETFK